MSNRVLHCRVVCSQPAVQTADQQPGAPPIMFNPNQFSHVSQEPASGGGDGRPRFGQRRVYPHKWGSHPGVGTGGPGTGSGESTPASEAAALGWGREAPVRVAASLPPQVRQPPWGGDEAPVRTVYLHREKAQRYCHENRHVPSTS